MKYRAKEKGFRNGSLVEVGDEFEADDFNGKWAVPVEEPPVEEPKKRGRPKKSESEVGKEPEGE